MQELIVLLIAVPEWLFGQLLKVLAYPLTPSARIFLPYLATSLLFAIFVYQRIKRTTGIVQPSLSRFLFPKHIWDNPSAWLDVRYFFFHQMFRLLIYGTFVTAVSVAVFNYVSDAPSQPLSETTSAGWLVELVYVVIAAIAIDFQAFATHYLQHKIPVLWEFHKVHHSATVMHPLTNYREHPVDNIFYALGLGVCLGLLTAGASRWIGHVPEAPAVFGVGVFIFAYNALGYNLRHSHIWLRWPGRLSMAFGSPAHHQVHHSYSPNHVDHNFAFMFPIWDVIFATYCVPETSEDVHFGLGEDQEQEYTSVLGMWFVPFRSVLRLLSPTTDSIRDRTD